MTTLTQGCLRFAAAVARHAGRRGVEATVWVALGAVLEGVGVLLLVPLLATLFDADLGGALSAPAAMIARFAPDLPPITRLGLILALFAGLMILRNLVLWRRDVVLGQLQIGFVEALRGNIARRLAATRWQTLASLGRGRVTHVMSGDIQRCGAGVHFLLQGGVAVVMLLVQGVVVFTLAPVLAALAVAMMAAGALAMSLLLRRSHDAGRQVTDANLALITGLGHFLSGMKLAISQNLQDRFVAGFERELETGARRQIAFIGQQAVLRGLWAFLAAVVAGTTMLIGYGVMGLPAPMLITLLVVLGRMSGPASQIQLGLQQIAYSLPAWEAATALEQDLRAAAASPRPSVARPRLKGAIALRDVVYRHGDDPARESGVNGLTLDLKPGELIGVAGASGAGKTTLADLLAGLIHPQSGHISIGGVALTEDNAIGWRDQVAYVAQDAVLFNDTVRSNLLWANPDAGEDAVAAALALVGADRVTARLPGGLDTVVGENGGLISGGERQRLALARALLRAPDILILDEATNAIDVAGERDILQRLTALPDRPTIVMIAHREQSLAFCDRIISLVDGRLVDESRRTAPAVFQSGREALT